MKYSPKREATVEMHNSSVSDLDFPPFKKSIDWHLRLIYLIFSVWLTIEKLAPSVVSEKDGHQQKKDQNSLSTVIILQQKEVMNQTNQNCHLSWSGSSDSDSVDSDSVISVVVDSDGGAGRGGDRRGATWSGVASGDGVK